MSELDTLVADGVIDEVLGRIKSGKEANISMVRRGDVILAAKVYKDRATRSFKNNAEYKEGRKVRNTRTQRAMDSGGKFGRDSAEQAWKSAEADALYKLDGTGVRTPAPVMFYEGVLLMELVLDADGRPAPRLIEVTLEPDAVLGVYCDLVAQIIAMLCCDLIHGDLSPYNILLASDGPTIIDFPQVISAAHSSRAEYYFLRDFDNVHGFLAAADPRLAIHRADGRAIWAAYLRRDLTPQFVPPPPPPLQPRRPDRSTRVDDRGPRPDRRPDLRGPRPDNRGASPRPDLREPRPDLRNPPPRPDPRGPRPDDRGAATRPDRRGPRPDLRNAPPQDLRGPQRTTPAQRQWSNPGSRPDPRSAQLATTDRRPDLRSYDRAQPPPNASNGPRPDMRGNDRSPRSDPTRQWRERGPHTPPPAAAPLPSSSGFRNPPPSRANPPPTSRPPPRPIASSDGQRPAPGPRRPRRRRFG